MSFLNSIPLYTLLIICIICFAILFWCSFVIRKSKILEAKVVIILATGVPVLLAVMRILAEKRLVGDKLFSITFGSYVVILGAVGLHYVNKYAKTEQAKAYLKSANISLIITAVGVLVFIVAHVLSKAGY